MFGTKVFRVVFTIFYYLNQSYTIQVMHDTIHKFPKDPNPGFEFQSGPSRGHHENFLKSAMDLIISNGLFPANQLEPMVFLQPNELETRFNFTLGEERLSNEDVLKIIQNLFEITPPPAHKFRLSRRVSGLDPLAVVGDWMAATMSNLVVTYQVAPIWSLMEIRMTEYLSRKIGWERPGDGVPTTGAGSGHSMAMATALIHVDKRIRDIGIAHITKPLVVYVSQHASISWKTAAMYNSLGTEAIFKIPVDEWGRMDTSILEQRVAEDKMDKVQVMVVATAGTPILGVIDPIEEVARICETHGIWLHVDAELAGGYFFSGDTGPQEKFINKLSGIHRADSVLISMWLFAAPYPTSMLLTKDSDALQNVFGLHAPYVFTGIDHYNGSYDRGDHTIQTSRRPEISKIWFAASRGELNNFDLFSLMEETQTSVIEYLMGREGFELVKESLESITWQVPLVSFFYVPKSFRGQERDAKVNAEITKTTLNIKKVLREKGFLDISVSYLPGSADTFPAFFTMSLTNTRFTADDIKFVADTIELVGEDGTLQDSYAFPATENEESTKLPLPNYPLETAYKAFMQNILKLALESGLFFSRGERCFDLQQIHFFDDPDTFDFQLPYHCDQLFPKLLKEFSAIINYSPKWAHPYFIYQLAAGLDPYTYVADLISPVLNTPMISYGDGSAPFMLMEQEIVKEMTKRVFQTEGDGIIVDGGSMGNQVAIALAKYNLEKEPFKGQGMKALNGKKFIIYLSQDAHYSTKKGAIFQGIGQNHTIEIEANIIGQMKVDKLIEAVKKTLQEGDIPLMVVITTGTTIYGAMDPIEAIVDVCKEYNIWSHVDGMFGGLVVMSDKHIGLFKGVERTDSWGADLHKLMGSTMVCTILITPHKGLFRKVFSLDDESQEEPDLEAGSELNLIGRHAQLDKRNNILKFWLLWKAKGRKGLEAHVDVIMSNKDYLIAELRRREKDGFELVIDNFDLTNICFRFIPRELNPKYSSGLDRNSQEWKTAMDTYTFDIEKEFVKNGIMCFVTQRRRMADGTDTVTFIKFVMMGSALTQEDIRFLLDTLVYYATKIQPVTNRAANQTGAGIYYTPAMAKEMEFVKNRFDPFGNLPKYYPVM